MAYIAAKVQVEIKDAKMVSIKLLEHRNERGKAAVSGATNSSNVIKKAIQNAVEKAKSR